MSDLSAPTVLGCRHCPETFPGTYPEADRAWMLHCRDRHPDQVFGAPIGRDLTDPVPDDLVPPDIRTRIEADRLAGRAERVARLLRRLW